jgi:predicted flap endonuclease-1-like 5' DNA nuclease
MTWLIALFALATAGIHLFLGANQITNPPAGASPLIGWIFILNGIGYIVLLVLYLMRRGTNRSMLRWIFIAYTALTIILYFIIAGSAAFSNTLGLITKAIEAILIILLLLDRKSDEAAIKAATPAVASRSASAAVGAGTSAAGAVGAAGAAAAGTAAYAASKTGASLDAIENTAEDVVADMGDGVSRAGEMVGDAAEAVVDVAEDAGAAAVAAGAAAVAAVKDLFDGKELPADEMRSRLAEYLPTLGDTSNFYKAIEYVEGIGDVYGQKLRAVGVDTPFELLVRGAFRRGRGALAAESGIEESRILTWTNNVDLYRIKGVGEEYADLLEQSGVDTIVELAQRNPANLHKRMLEINEQKKLVRRPPHLSQVQSWVEQAKGLPRVMHY